MKTLAKKIAQQRIEVKRWENYLKIAATSRTWANYYAERKKLIEMLELLEN